MKIMSSPSGTESSGTSSDDVKTNTKSVSKIALFFVNSQINISVVKHHVILVFSGGFVLKSKTARAKDMFINGELQ